MTDISLERLLDHPEVAAPALLSPSPVLRFSHRPARRRTAQAWVVLADLTQRRSDRAVVRELEVTRPADPGSELSCTVRDVAIQLQQVEAWCAEAAALQLPLFVSDGPIGLDGTRYAMWTGNGAWTGLDLSWWADGPAEWKHITQWARGMMDRLHKLVAGSAST